MGVLMWSGIRFGRLYPKILFSISEIGDAAIHVCTEYHTIAITTLLITGHKEKKTPKEALAAIGKETW